MNAFRACFRKCNGLPWLVCSTALLLNTAAYGQARPPTAETPPGGLQTIPEIQPGHSAKGNTPPEAPNKEPAPSPQTAFPSPQHEGKEKGVIRPPPVGDTGVRAPPRSSNAPMPVIPPPGSPGGNQSACRSSSAGLGCGRSLFFHLKLARRGGPFCLADRNCDRDLAGRNPPAVVTARGPLAHVRAGAAPVAARVVPRFRQRCGEPRGSA